MDSKTDNLINENFSLAWQLLLHENLIQKRSKKKRKRKKKRKLKKKKRKRGCNTFRQRLVKKIKCQRID